MFAVVFKINNTKMGCKNNTANYKRRGKSKAKYILHFSNNGHGVLNS